MRRYPHFLRSLENRNFRIFFVGQSISFLGSWIQQVAMSWLVYRITGSTELLGISVFASLFPQLVVGPLTGVLADRYNRRTLLIAVELGLATQAVLLAVLNAFALITPFILIALSLVLGILNAMETPLRQSSLGLMIKDRADLSNAVALNASLYNIGRFIGPPIAGLLLTATSESFCFIANAVTFIVLVIGLMRMDLATTGNVSRSMGTQFFNGLRYAFQHSTIRTAITGLAILNLTASSYVAILPAYSKEMFAGNAGTLGLLWGAAGLGAISATTFLASLRSHANAHRIMYGGMSLAMLALFVLPFCHNLPLAMLAMVALGFGISVNNVFSNTLMQSIAPENMRGRIISMFTSIRFGFDALGGLIAGFLAAAIGLQATLIVEGIVLFIAIAVLLTQINTLRNPEK